MNRFLVALLVVLSAVTLYGLSYAASVHCFRAGHCLIENGSATISMMEAFSFGGVLITILAFVAAFAIILMAIDAFSISSAVNRNAERVRENLNHLDEIDDRLAKAQAFVDALDVFVAEIDAAGDESDQVFFLLEVIEDRLDLGEGIKHIILKGRQSLRARRARLNAIRAIVSKLHDPTVSIEIGSAIPELIAGAEKDHSSSREILALLRKHSLLSSEEEAQFDASVSG